MTLRAEIFDQPDVAERMIETLWPAVEAVARELVRPPPFVYVAARGSSDNAGRYAKYLLGIENRLPVALALPSLFTMYEAPPRLEHALVLGISQSGESPDLLRTVSEARSQGARTLVITNAAGSPLARAGEHVIEIGAGHEEAVAATKTYTGQLIAVAMLSVALAGDAERRHALDEVPRALREALALDDRIRAAAERYRYMEQCVVIGRGYHYATAHEWSLKLEELTYVAAEPYSSADFRHGPIAIVERGFPVLAAVSRGAVASDAVALLRKLVRERGAELVVVSDVDDALELAQTALRVPRIPEWLAPMVAIVPAQLFCYHLTRAKGLDPEHPRGLRKITSTE